MISHYFEKILEWQLTDFEKYYPQIMGEKKLEIEWELGIS
jgi:hypothetical protein